MSGLRRLPDFQKIDPHLRTHPRFVAFRDRLGVETPLAHGLLAGLWAFAFDHARDGNLSRFTPVEIASSIGWRGDADALMSALTIGFLVGGQIHDWHDWGGALFEARDKESRKKYDQYHSEQGKLSREKTGEADVLPGENGSIGEKIPEEKRREKIKSKNFDDGDASSVREDFEKWWIAYGRVGSKALAKECYVYWRRQGYSAERLLAAIQPYLADCFANDRSVQHAATFLKKRINCWEEWITEEHGSAKPGGNGKRPASGAVLPQGFSMRQFSDLDAEGRDVIHDVLWDDVNGCEAKEIGSGHE